MEQYDGVLRLNLIEGSKTIAFVDDLAQVIETESPEDMVFKTNTALEDIAEWMALKDLQMEPSKTEAIILKGPR